MSWVPEKRFEYGWMDTLAMKILKCGNIPGHVAFIMDGNRRFAKQNNLEKIQGHSQGFEKLAEALQWCHDLGVKEVTVYAFSIENFNRPESEVTGLLNLAREKFQRLINEKDKLAEHGVRVNVLGKLDLLPLDLQILIKQATDCTSSNNSCVLNIAFAYKSREEITHAVRQSLVKVRRSSLDPEDITEELVDGNLYTSVSGTGLRPDLLIRTSGEKRLSDFLLWQTSYSVTYFADVLWPDFTLRNFIYGLFYYQRRFQYRRQVANALPRHLERHCRELFD